MPLDPDLLGIAAELVALRKRAKELGVFTNDRELLVCQSCGLMEDVAATGVLITCREPNLGQDTGLRFEPLSDQTFRCPACGQRVRESLSEQSSEGASQA